MFEFVGDWTEEEKSLFAGIGNSKIGGRSFVVNPFTLVKSGDSVSIETSRASFRKMKPSTVDGAAMTIKQYYATL